MMPDFKGSWTGNHGTVYTDKNTGFQVDVLNTKANLQFFKRYKSKLKERFKQEEIYIVGYEIYVIQCFDNSELHNFEKTPQNAPRI